MEGSCQQDFPQDAGKLVRWSRVPVAQACASLSVGGNDSLIQWFWCKELFVFVALQSCVYSSFIPGIFSVLLVPMVVDTVEWDSLKCFSAFVVTVPGRCVWWGSSQTFSDEVEIRLSMDR